MEDRCVCCGRIIPEGRYVCPVCENSEAGDHGSMLPDDLTQKEKALLFNRGNMDEDY